MGKIKSAVKKYGKYVAGGLAVGGLALGAKKLLGKKKGKVGRFPTRRRGISGLRTQVQRLSLRIKKKQLQRKLFKEEMRL